LRREGRTASAEPVCSCASLSTPCTRDRGCSAHPVFPAPSFFRADEFANSGAACRENAQVCLDGGIFFSSFRDAPLGADPESITPVTTFGAEQQHRGYGFSDAQLRIVVRARARPQVRNCAPGNDELGMARRTLRRRALTPPARYPH
jgi:hypothetical protein